MAHAGADRESALALVARVGLSEAMRQTGIPKTTLHRWATAAGVTPGTGRNGTERTAPNRPEGGSDGGESGRGRPKRDAAAPPSPKPPANARARTTPDAATVPRASQLLDPEVRTALEQLGVDPDTVPMDQMAIIAMRRELATLAAGRANKPNQSALMVAILADKVKDLATIERADTEPEVEDTDPTEAGRLAELWAAANGLRLVPADETAQPESADPYDPDTAGGARAAGGPRLVVVNSNDAE